MVTNNACDQKNTGLQSLDSTGNFQGRTLTSANTSITVADGSGVSGNPTITAVDASSVQKGVASFDSGDFTVTAGNVVLNATGVGQTITGDAGGALSPSGGNWSILGGSNGIDTSGSGSTLTLNFDVTETGCITTVNGDSGSATATSNAITIAGAGSVTTSASGSTVTITSSGGGMTWNEETGASVNAAVNNGYITNNAGAVTVNLPGTFAVGDIIAVVGKGNGGWIIDAPAGDTIRLGSSATATGGTFTSTNQYDCVELIGTVANDTWTARSSVGNITIA